MLEPGKTDCEAQPEKEGFDAECIDLSFQTDQPCPTIIGTVLPRLDPKMWIAVQTSVQLNSLVGIQRSAGHWTVGMVLQKVVPVLVNRKEYHVPLENVYHLPPVTVGEKALVQPADLQQPLVPLQGIVAVKRKEHQFVTVGQILGYEEGLTVVSVDQRCYPPVVLRVCQSNIYPLPPYVEGELSPL